MTVAAPAYLQRSDTVDQRLYPRLTNSRYAVATLLRRAIEDIAAAHLVKIPAAALLDFGCGDMPYRTLLAPHVARYQGIDLPGNARADFILHDDGATAAPDACADIVLSTQVLEHVADPAQYLRESFRMLKPGGTLVLSTHGYWLYHADPTDYWRWTGPGLQKLIESSGLETIELRGVLGLAPAGLQLFHDGVIRRILAKRLRPLIGPLVSFFLQPALLLLDKFHTPQQRAQDAAIFIIVAKKPSDRK